MTDLIERLRSKVGMIPSGEAADRIEKDKATIERLTGLQRVTELGVIAIESAHQECEAENKKLRAVYEAVLPLSMSGTHIYDLDITLGEAIKALSAKEDTNE